MAEDTSQSIEAKYNGYDFATC